MKYFARINGNQVGPLELEQLPTAGVTPDTYVWCKTMDDWQKAGDVADICRMFRRRLAGLPPVDRPVPQPAEPAAGKEDEELKDVPLRFRHYVRQSGTTPGPSMETENIDNPPMSMTAIAIMMTLFCFPPTGFAAIYYSVLAGKTWKKAVSPIPGNGEPLSDSQRQELKKLAHDFSRQARMWTGISFFLGMILWSFLSFKL